MEELATLSNVMKDYYEPTVPQIWNNELTLYADIEKTSRGIDGKNILIPLQIGENERGVGDRREGGTLPTGGENEYEQASLYLKYSYAILSLTNQAIKLTKGENTLIRELERSMNSTLNALNHDTERKFWGDSTGLVATASSVASNVVTVDSAKFFRRGMYVDVYDTGGTTQRTPVSTYYIVEQVDRPNNTVTLNDATNVVATDKLYREGNVYLSGGSLVSNEMIGFQNMMSDSNTFENIARASNPWWQATINDNGGTPRTLTDMIMMAAIDAHVDRTGLIPDQLIGSLGMRRAFKKMLDDANQPAEEIPTKAGFKKGMAYHYGDKAIPVLGSRFGPSTTFYGFNTEYLWLAEGAPLEWCDLGGGILKPREGTDTVWGKMSWYVNFAADRGDSFMTIADITEQ